MNKDNRWVQLAAMIPWWRAEEKYAKSFKQSMRGQVPLSVRMALGALYIQERMQLDDRETVQQITENPYYQYFLGLPQFQDEPLMSLVTFESSICLPKKAAWSV